MSKTQKQGMPEWFDGKKINEILFCEAFRKEQPMICINDQFFTVDGLIADPGTLEAEIFNTIKYFVTEKVSGTVKSLMGVLKLMCHSEPLSQQTDRIHVANGTYYLDGHFDPEKQFCLNRLKVAYNEIAPRPERFLAFLDDLLYPEDIPTLQEYMGYCLIPTNKAQKMMIITGNGGEGKSRLGLVMRSILGDNMSTSSIQSVERNRFTRATLEYKLLMVDDDMKLQALPETSYIKTMVTLEGKMDLEWKGKQSEQRMMYCRFLCFGNGPLLALYDRTHGFHRRQSLLSVRDRDASRVDDPYLSEKLESEAEGIFLWMVEGLKRLIEIVGGEQYILSAVMHADERNRAMSEALGEDVFHYHLHVVYIPVVEKQILWSKRCKEKSLIGTVKETIMQVSSSKKWISKPTLDEDGNSVLNSKGKPILRKSYSVLQDDYFNAMRAAGYTDVERGERGSTEEHLTVTQFKVQQEAARLEVLEAQTEKKEQQLQRIEQKTKVKKSQAATFEEIDSMGRKTFTGKIEFTPHEAEQLKNLAKKAISASAVIADLKKKLEASRQDVRIWKDRYESLQAQTKDFLAALKKAPEAVKAFLSRILHMEKKELEQEKKQRENALVK